LQIEARVESFVIKVPAYLVSLSSRISFTGSIEEQWTCIR